MICSDLHKAGAHLQDSGLNVVDALLIGSNEVRA